MRLVLVVCAALAMAACGKQEAAAPDQAPAPSGAQQETATAALPVEEQSANVIPPQSSQEPPGYRPMDMSPTDSMPACRAGLKAKGLNEAELDIMLGPMAGVCPNNGVTEGRIREILTTIWTQAGCHQHSPIEVARALDSGACGGDAG